MKNKISFTILGALVYIWTSIWVFNHINPYLSIAMIIGGIIYGSNKIKF
jgi:hypothetical protein